MRTSRSLFLSAIAALFALSAAAQQTMPLSQIHKGMRGYGVTVFEGTKLDRFDVEILGVLNNIGPGQDLILAKVDAPTVQRAGVIAGMSGSPVYIDGKVIGALAYSWQFAKEPVAGITPIEQMLKIAESGGAHNAELTAVRMSAGDFLKAIADHKTEDLFAKMQNGLAGATPASTMSGAKPIAVPLSLSSFAPETITRFAPWLDAMGFVAVPSGSTSTSAATTSTTAAPFRPGDAVGAVLLNGDFNVAATGTVTVVDGDQIYAFGHPFLDMGEVSFPMAKSEIITVMPSLASSFKFANTGAIVGAFKQDRANGIMGTVGTRADMIPIDLTVEGSGLVKNYHVNIVRHTQLSPLILAMAADSVVANAQRAAGERTVLLESEIKLKGFSQPIVLHEGWAGAQARQAIPAYLAIVAGYLMSNEFRPADIESVKLHLRHDDGLKIAKLLEASVDTPAKGRFTPGDTVKVRTLLKPFRGEPFTETFDVKIPDNQAPGPAYLLIGSGSLMNQIDFSLVPPDPRTLEGVLAVLQRLRPSTDLTLGLYSQSDGAVTAGVYLPDLPPTMRAVVAGDTSNGAQAAVKYHPAAKQARPLGYIIDGALKIDLDIKPTI
ncbi:MAG TPA: SpoIVB peptidase S55 domain-containing protein [Thermoanaerobaculia bacterium]|nr:SpoIVB peptidase S55 domain-containing protein [Thermoanaerobaculia bacterium]